MESLAKRVEKRQTINALPEERHGRNFTQARSKMPRKRKIKTEPEDSSKPDSGVRRVKIKQEEDQSTPLSPRARDRELRAAAALSRLEQHKSPKTEANQLAQICEESPIPEWNPAPVRKRDDSRTATKKEIFPYKMMQKIEAMKNEKGDNSTTNVIFVVAHELTGQWIDTEFTIVGAYRGFQSANEQVMKYFSGLDITIEDERWSKASSAASMSDAGELTWHIGWDGCLALYFDDGKWGSHRVYAKRIEISP